MTLYRPKKGPVFTRGRLQHLLAGALGTLAGGLLAKVAGGTFYDGATAGASIISVFGAAWEAATPVIARHTRWKHPWGDTIDFLSYQAGVWIVALPVGLIGAAS